jgi:hypothetical protein
VAMLAVAVKGRLFALCVTVTCLLGYMGVQLIAAVHYKPEGCGFDSQWGYWNFSLT